MEEEVDRSSDRYGRLGTWPCYLVMAILVMMTLRDSRLMRKRSGEVKTRMWLMVPVSTTSDVMPPPSTYEVGGPSTAAAEGQSFTLPAPGFPVPPSMIEALSTRMGNLEYGHGQLVKKVLVMASQMVQAEDKLVQVGTQVEQGQQAATQRDETMVSEMSSRESTLMQCILGMDRLLADLERRPPGPQ
ncbi:hypothetical protein Tco_0781009 [Tanacetum coccineum]